MTRLEIKAKIELLESAYDTACIRCLQHGSRHGVIDCSGCPKSKAFEERIKVLKAKLEEGNYED